MPETPKPQPSRFRLMLAGGGALVLGAAGGWLGHDWGDRSHIEHMTQDYVLAHPEIVPQAMAKLADQQTAQALTARRGAIEVPWPGAVLGNPMGRVTVVEFTDYACGYCRASVADIDALIAANPDVRVVVRELPILTPESADAAKMALLAARQGKYAAFRRAMFAAGRPDAGTIASAAREAGLDTAKAQAMLNDPALAAEIDRNLDLARAIGVEGTPGWVVGGAELSGAVGREALNQAVAAARRGKPSSQT